MSKATIDLEKDKFNAQGEVKVAGAFEGGRKTDYSSADVTTLSSSTDINKWLGAYNDGVLKKEFVESFDYSNKGTAYYTHPGLGDGNKCLRIFCLYTGTPPNRVLTAKFANVVNWSYDSSLQGVLALTLGSITSPGVSSTTGTDVCTVSFTDTGTTGTYSLALSGTNAASYQLNNTTQGQTGSTITNVLKTDTVVIETASNFGGITYSHSATCTLTDTNTSRTTTQNFSTTGTAVTADNEFALISQVTNTTTDIDFSINGSEKSLWPSLGINANTFPYDTQAWSLAFWLYAPTASRTNTFRTCLIKQQVGAAQGGIQVFMRGVVDIELYITSTTANNYSYAGSNDINFDAWNHVIFTYDGSGDLECYVDAGSAGNNGGTYPTALNNTTIDNLELHTFVHTPGAGAAKHRANDNCRLDELIAFNIELSASQRTELYNSGEWIDPSDLSFSGNVDSYFRMGDGSNDDVANNKTYDEEDNSRYFEKVGTGTHRIVQLTMDDDVYSSGSGNHKYVSDTQRGSVSSSALVGNYNRDSSTDEKGFFPDLDQSSAFRSSSNVSYSFWTKFSSTNSGFFAFFQERYNSSQSDQSYFAVYATSSLFYLYTTYNGGRRYRRYSIPAYNTWKHVVITTTSDDVVTNATVYFDGVAQTPSASHVTNSIVRTGHSVNTLSLGGTLLHKDQSNGTYTGGNAGSGTFIMDEFSTWKKTLSASEVTELYNSGSPTDLTQHSAATDLQRWFRFGDTTNDGTAIKDSQETSVELTSFDSQNNIQNH